MHASVHGTTIERRGETPVSPSKKKGVDPRWLHRQPAWARGRRAPMPADHHGCCNLPKLELLVSPSGPAAAARIGPTRPRSGLAAMRDLGSRVQSPPPCALHMATTRRPCAAAHRPVALDQRCCLVCCPKRRCVADEKDPAYIIGGAGFAQSHPSVEVKGRYRGGAA
jgi:hypothetical protein